MLLTDQEWLRLNWSQDWPIGHLTFAEWFLGSERARKIVVRMLYETVYIDWRKEARRLEEEILGCGSSYHQRD